MQSEREVTQDQTRPVQVNPENLAQEPTIPTRTDTARGLYNDVKGWLENDPEYQNQLSELKRVYGRDDVEEEAIAKTLQTKFGNQEEINNLVNYNPSLARKIYDWVVNKLNNFTGGRIEGLYWADIKNKFERAYSESGNYATNEETMFAKKTTNDGTKYVELDGKLFKNKDGTQKTPKEAYEALIGRTLVLDDGSEVKIIKKLPGNKNIYNELIRRYPRQENVNNIKKVNNQINGNIDEVLEQSNFLSNREDINGRHSQNNIKSFDTRVVKVYDGDQAYRLTLSIAELNNGEKIGYAKKLLKPDTALTQKIKKESTTSLNPTNGESSRVTIPNRSIPQNGENVNAKMSITPTTDNEGNTLSKQQQEYFKDNNGQRVIHEITGINRTATYLGWNDFSLSDGSSSSNASILPQNSANVNASSSFARNTSANPNFSDQTRRALKNSSDCNKRIHSKPDNG